MDIITIKIIGKMEKGDFIKNAELASIVACIDCGIPLCHLKDIQNMMLSFLTIEIRLGHVMLIERDR